MRAAAGTLGADVFAVLAARGGADWLPPVLEGWLTGHAFFPDGAGPASVRLEYARANPGNSSGDLIAAYAAVGGNFLGPLVGNEGRNAFLLRDLWRCMELVAGYEGRHGMRYRYLAFNRLDMHWLVPPPPFHVLREADPRAMWIPDGQDWDGLNDRFALVPRRWAAAYFGRWPRLLNGSLLPAVREAAGKGLLDLKFDAGPEWLLRATLRAAGARVRRFAAVAAVLCQPGSKRGRYGRCTKPSASLGLSFKYSAEASEAHASAARLQHLGWRWRASTAAPRLRPGCFESEQHQRSCCATSAGLNGDANCWTDVYSYARCCHGDRPGLWILPSAAQARELLAQGAAPVCWKIVAEVEMCLGEAELEQLA